MTTAIKADAEAEPTALQAARLVESVVGNAWATDAGGRFIYVTPSALERLDLTLRELDESSEQGMFGWRRAVHPDDYEAAAAAWRHSLRTGEPYSVEHRLLRGVGVYVRGRSSGQPVRDADGRIAGWFGTVVEVGELAVPPEKFSELAGPALQGRTAAERLASLDSIHPDDRPAAAMAAARAFWTGVPQVMRYRQQASDGTYRWTKTRTDPGNRPGVEIGALETRVEQPTTTSPDLVAGLDADPVRAAKIIENVFGNGWAFDRKGAWIYLPLFAQTTLGLTPADLNASLDEGHVSWKRLLHPDEYDRVSQKWRHCLETGESFQDEFRIRRATGIYAWARSAARPSRDDAGRITGWYGTSIDIDVYRKTVETLLDRECELSQLVDMVPSHLWRLTPEGRPTYFNRRLIEFVGFDVDAAVSSGGDPLVFFAQAAAHPDDAGIFARELRRCLSTGEPFAMRYRLRRSDGVCRWMSSRAVPMRDQAGRIVQWYGLCHDIDDQIHAEEALRETSERLARAAQAASLAELAASIAHEVNQPLAAIVAHSHACHRWLSAQPPNLERAKITAERITRDANGAADVMSRVRALFR